MLFSELSEISQQRAIEEYIKTHIWRCLREVGHVNRRIVKTILENRQEYYDIYGRLIIT